jgi:hypothetical protein
MLVASTVQNTQNNSTLIAGTVSAADIQKHLANSRGKGARKLPAARPSLPADAPAVRCYLYPLDQKHSATPVAKANAREVAAKFIAEVAEVEGNYVDGFQALDIQALAQIFGAHLASVRVIFTETAGERVCVGDFKVARTKGYSDATELDEYRYLAEVSDQMTDLHEIIYGIAAGLELWTWDNEGGVRLGIHPASWERSIKRVHSNALVLADLCLEFYCEYQEDLAQAAK